MRNKAWGLLYELLQDFITETVCLHLEDNGTMQHVYESHAIDRKRYHHRLLGATVLAEHDTR